MGIEYYVSEIVIVLAEFAASRSIWSDIFITVAGAFFSVVFGVWYHNGGHARLMVTAGNTDERNYPRMGVVRFLMIVVENRPLRLPFARRQTAQACHGFVEFFDPSGDRVCDRMPIRWNSAPEPVRFGTDDVRGEAWLDPSLLETGARMDIAPGEKYTLSPAVKFGFDSRAFGWTTASYWRGWKDERYGLPFGRLRASVEVQAGDVVARKDFWFYNPEEGVELFMLEQELPRGETSVAEMRTRSETHRQVRRRRITS